MEVKIGIVESIREISLDSSASSAEIQKIVSDVFSGDQKLLTLEDTKGRKYFVPAHRVAYVEIGSEDKRKVGFS